MKDHITKLPSVEEIGYKFKNEKYLLEALTHPSYASENSLDFDNQRLEFLGDSVIQLIVTVYLYAKYPGTDEGKLTKMRSFLTQKSTLATFAEHIKISSFIRMGRGEIKSDGHKRKSTLCDAFEALCGAIFVDGGIKSAREFIIPLIDFFYPSPDELISAFNPKGYLQELLQGILHVSPEYRLDSIDGPPHKRIFTVSLWVDKEKISSATEHSRKAAEIKAAEEAIKILKQTNKITSQQS